MKKWFRLTLVCGVLVGLLLGCRAALYDRNGRWFVIKGFPVN
jgi:hypothetical protein